MRRWFDKLVAGFWAWVEEVCDEPEERLDPPHEYYERGTLGFKRMGDRCKRCGTWDGQRRAHNETLCERPYKPELA